MEIQTLTEAQTLDDVKMFRSKLAGMKDHLETLLRKKIRLESEITILRKAIKNKEKNFALSLKTKVSLESQMTQPEVEIFGDNIFIRLPREWNEEVQQNLNEVCILTQEIEEMLRDYGVG